MELHRVLVEDIRRVDPRATLPDFDYQDKTRFVEQCKTLSSLCIKSDTDSSVMGAQYLVGSVVRKYPFDIPGIDRRQAALNTFIGAETACSLFNTTSHRILRDAPGQRLISLCREYITGVVGNTLPPFEALTSEARHGPGASVGTDGDKTSAYYKYARWPYTVTADALDLSRALIQSDPRWMGALEDSYRRRFGLDMWTILNWPVFWSNVFEIVPGNRITTVPKDCATDRTIAIEPTMNMMLQLGVDGFIRRRLKRTGVDLDNQLKNCYLSMIGHDSDLATLDLSAASDSISLRVCKLLLPSDWYTYIIRLRSHQGTLPSGDTVRYSKVSSMGNGYTFALEALIFASVVYASHKLGRWSWNKKKIAVYGDDLIMPSTVAMICNLYLQRLGFTVNTAKSYTAGPFRESCGTDWYKGKYVRPVLLKSPIASIPDLYVLHNRLRYWSFEVYGEPDMLTSTLALIVSRIPQGYRFYGVESSYDFSTYLHKSEANRTPCRLVFRNTGFKASEYFFLKLLAKLKPIPDTVCQIERNGTRKSYLLSSYLSSVGITRHNPLAASLYATSGSVFEVTRRNSGGLVVVRSTAPLGRSSYQPLGVTLLEQQRP